MTSQYDLEDKIVSADEMTDSWQQEGKALATIPEEVALAMNEAGEFLRAVYDQMAAAGNEAGLTLISEAWGRIEFMGTKNVLMANRNTNADEVIQFINDERLSVVAKLDDLETALAENDSDHPALEDYASYMREEGFSDAYEAALDESEKTVFDDIMIRVQHLTGCDKYQAYCVTRILNDSRAPQPEQVALLTQLANTFQGKS
jgi:hypothetical protein